MVLWYGLTLNLLAIISSWGKRTLVMLPLTPFCAKLPLISIHTCNSHVTSREGYAAAAPIFAARQQGEHLRTTGLPLASAQDLSRCGCAPPVSDDDVSFKKIDYAISNK
jgi:hypothetical protein